MVPEEIAASNRHFVGREWTLPPLHSWLKGDRGRFLILTGYSGSGKSSLAGWLLGAGPEPPERGSQVLLQSIRRSWRASYFCSRRLRFASHDPWDFTEYLSKQVFQAIQTTESSTKESSQNQSKIAGSATASINYGSVIGVNIEKVLISGATLGESFTSLVRKPLSNFLVANPGERFPILVDAPDEAMHRPSPNILDLLVDGFATLPANGRLLVCVQQKGAVLDRFKEAYPDVMIIDLSDEEGERQSQQDVRRYVQAVVENHGTDLSDELLRARVDDISRVAGSNFLVAASHLADLERGNLTVSLAMPESVAHRFGQVCRRIWDTDPSTCQNGRWAPQYMAFLGCLAAAFGPIDALTLSRWLEIERESLILMTRALAPLVERDSTTGQYRFVHSYLQQFFFGHTGDEEMNVQFQVSEGKSHAFIVDRYLGHDTTLDMYACRFLPAHVVRLVELLPDGVDDDDVVLKTADLFLSQRLAAAARRHGMQESEIAQTYRQVLALYNRPAYASTYEALVTTLSTSNNPYMRGVVLDSLVQYLSLFPDSGIEILRALASMTARDSWQIALEAAVAGGQHIAESVLIHVLRSGVEAIQSGAPYMLYPYWTAHPPTWVMGLLRRLIDRISVWRPLFAIRVLEFAANVCIATFINHCHNRQLLREISDLWEYVLIHKLHIRAISKPHIDRFLLSPTFAHHLSRQIVEVAFAGRRLDLDSFFGREAPLNIVVERVIPLIDVREDASGHDEDILQLLELGSLIQKILACQLIAIHSFAKLDDDWIVSLYDRGGARARVWILLSFSVLLPDSPRSWLPLLEMLTKRVVTDELTRGEILGWSDSDLVDVEAWLVPLGLAYGRANRYPTVIKELSQSADSRFRMRFYRALGVLGLYEPGMVIAVMTGQAENDVPSDDELLSTLVPMYPIQRNYVEAFLQAVERSALRSECVARVEASRIYKVMQGIGHYNNGVNEGVRYPIMREGMLKPVYQLLVECETVREFLRRYSEQILLMLRIHDYKMANWGDQPLQADR
jgi:energy-coupling factor transporter ATP-binding protein EcfA2